MSGRVVVVGSCNLDIVVAGGELPAPGETVAAERITTVAGGKGLNQAIAAARAGARVDLIGAVGDDPPAAVVCAALRDAGVGTESLRTVPGATGAAVVTVGRSGENCISVVAGANAAFGSLSARDRDLIRDADVLLMQLEVPMELVADAAAVARTGGTTVVITPAPVQQLDPSMWATVDMLLANRTEALALTGEPDAAAALRALRFRIPRVVVTVGSDGAYWADAEGQGRTPAHQVEAVDTTGAGDAFAGYLAAAVANATPLSMALDIASAAAAISVTRTGASVSIPTAAEVDSMMVVSSVPKLSAPSAT